MLTLHQLAVLVQAAAAWVKAVAELVLQALPDRGLLEALQVATSEAGHLVEVEAVVVPAKLDSVVSAVLPTRAEAVME